MKRIPVEQNTEAWRRLRLGIPTASRMAKIITPKNLKPSTQARELACELIVERWLGEPADSAKSGFMERGSELEPEARGWYEMATGDSVSDGGFVLTDDRWVGCSPDGWVGDGGLIEIKTPGALNFVKFVVGADDAASWKLQCQAQMLVCERDWVDLIFFHPQAPYIERVVRDEEVIVRLREGIDRLYELLAEYEDRFVLRHPIFWEPLNDDRIAEILSREAE